jgi:RNA-directed DNA polymerase
MNGTVNYLEKELNLPVNKKKSQVALIKDVTFLGFNILRGKIRISDKARVKFKKKTRELTRRNNPLSMFQIIQDLNEYLRGWSSYFKIQEFLQIFKLLDGWIRSRLRSMRLKKWKNPRKFQRMMIRAGYKTHEAQRVWMKMNKWQSVNRKEVRFAMNLSWFKKQGLYFSHVKKQKILELPFGC